MGFDLAPPPGDRGEPDVRQGRVGGGALGEERRLVRDGLQVLARGALVCPCCSLPLPGHPAVAASAPLHCGWCAHAAPARAFLREGVLDTPANSVRLVARLS